MNTTVASVAVLAFAAASAFAQAPVVVLNDDDGNPFDFLSAQGDVTHAVLNDDDGNRIVLLPMNAAPVDLVGEAGAPGRRSKPGEISSLAVTRSEAR